MPPKDDPLNLMRIIPSQGARIRSHAAFPPHGFFHYELFPCHPESQKASRPGGSADLNKQRSSLVSSLAPSKPIQRMIASEDSTEGESTRTSFLPNSKKVLRPQARSNPTSGFPSAKSRSRQRKTMSGEIEVNEPVSRLRHERSWGDGRSTISMLTEGLPVLARKMDS